MARGAKSSICLTGSLPRPGNVPDYGRRKRSRNLILSTFIRAEKVHEGHSVCFFVPSTKEQLWQRTERPYERKLGFQAERKRTTFLVRRISTSTARTSQVGQFSRMSCRS